MSDKSSNDDEYQQEQGIEDNQNDSNDEQERFDIRKELSTMSFKDLIKLKEELGSKIYNEAIFGPKIDKKSKNIQKLNYKRINKNRPREMSAKRPVPLLGNESKKINKKMIRDPRFDDKCGDYNSTKFKNNYDFINEIREKEVITLKEQLKNETDENERKRIKFVIQRLENQNREEKKRKIKENSIQEEKEEIRKAIQEGRKPHYQTKKERRTKELVKQFEELKNSGRLQKHVEKRRKKLISKDRKKMNF